MKDKEKPEIEVKPTVIVIKNEINITKDDDDDDKITATAAPVEEPALKADPKKTDKALKAPTTFTDLANQSVENAFSKFKRRGITLK